MWPFTKKIEPPTDLIHVPRSDEIAGLRNELAAARRTHRSVVSAAEESIRQHRAVADDALRAFERKRR